MLERARTFCRRSQCDFFTALWATRAGNVFTTHTPVAAAFDTFALPLLLQVRRRVREPRRYQAAAAAGAWAAGIPTTRPSRSTWPISPARTCGSINGVSALHGEVSRRIFGPLFPRWPERRSARDHVTNAVHVPSWDSPCGRSTVDGSLRQGALARRAATARRRGRPLERCAAVGVPRHGAARPGRVRAPAPAAPVRAARRRPGLLALVRGALDPNVLTLGFARRFTEYKRPDDAAATSPSGWRACSPTRRGRCSSSSPARRTLATRRASAFVRQWVEFVRRLDVRTQVVFLEDYDMALAEQLVQGVDVWINTPRRPWEASGTSGMKVLVERRAQSLGTRRLVGRGLRAGRRLGARRRCRACRDRELGRTGGGPVVRTARARGRARVLRARPGWHSVRLGRAHPCEPRQADAALQQQSHAGGVSRAAVPARCRGASAPRGPQSRARARTRPMGARAAPALARNPLGKSRDDRRGRRARVPRAGVSRRSLARGR